MDVPVKSNAQNNSEIARLKSGDIFGEMTVFAGTPRAQPLKYLQGRRLGSPTTIAELIEEELQLNLWSDDQCATNPARSGQNHVTTFGES